MIKEKSSDIYIELAQHEDHTFKITGDNCWTPVHLALALVWWEGERERVMRTLTHASHTTTRKTKVCAKTSESPTLLQNDHTQRQRSAPRLVGHLHSYRIRPHLLQPCITNLPLTWTPNKDVLMYLLYLPFRCQGIASKKNLETYAFYFWKITQNVIYLDFYSKEQKW